MRWVLLFLVVAMVAAGWALAFYLPELRGFAELLTALVALGATLTIGIPWAIERRRRALAERPKTGGAAEKAAAERHAAAGALRERARGALADVERTRRGAARQLPFYLVVGSAGSAGESLLEAWDFARAAGRADDRRPESERAPAPCRTWCSRQAVAVALAESPDEAEQREGWLATLDELRRARPRPRVAGAVVAIALSDLAPDPGAAAERLRARLDEILERLEAVVPVYLFLTGAEKIPGFADYWADFSKPDDSAWGAAFAPDDDGPANEPAAAVQREIDLMADALHVRLLDRLAREADAARRVPILRFPAEFRRFAEPVASAVETLCKPGPSPEPIVLRGFYFVATDAGPASAGGHTVIAEKGTGGGRYFASDVLRSVILPDVGLARPARAAVHRLAKRDVVACLAALGAALLVLGPATANYVRNVDLAGAVQGAARGLASAPPSSVPGTVADPIEPALDVLDRCDVAARAFGVPGWWSPRAARELRDPLRDAYLVRLAAWMNGRLRPELDRRLDAIALGPGLADLPASPEDRTPMRDAYDVVELDATLVEPAGHVTAWAVQRLAALWADVLPAGESVGPDRLVEHARNYLAALSEKPELAWPASRALFAARERLRRVDVRGMPYRRVLLAARSAEAVRASAVFGAAVDFLTSKGAKVPGAFTAAGWQRIQAALRSSAPLPESATIEGWVLDDASLPKDDRELRQSIARKYFDEYGRLWMEFFDEVAPKRPADVEMATAELAALKEGRGFYRSLFDSLKENTIREDADSGADAGGLLDRLPWFKSESDAGAKRSEPSPVERIFRPLLVFGGAVGPDGGPAPASGAPLDRYLAILDKLKAALDAPPAEQTAHDPFDEARTAIAALLDGVEAPTHDRLLHLLLPPALVQTPIPEPKWAPVWSFWDKNLRAERPFARSGPAAAFPDFLTFFRPDGMLWSFVQGQLGDYVEANGERVYVARPGGAPLSTEFLGCLTVAQQITDAFFVPGEDPGLKFSVQGDWTASDVDGARFVMGSKEVPLAKGQWAGPIRWLGEDVRVDWLQGGRPMEELGRHSFSLFDLFEHLGGLQPANAGRPLYSVDCPPLTLRVRPEGKVDVFRPDFFSRLDCPRELRAAP